MNIATATRLRNPLGNQVFASARRTKGVGSVVRTPVCMFRYIQVYRALDFKILSKNVVGQLNLLYARIIH